MNNILNLLGEIGIIPVVKIDNSSDSLNLAEALMEGNLPVAEITFRTGAAEESILKISKQFPEMLLGAGTVLSIENVKRAVGAGAQFIVAPGFNPTIVEYCVKNNISVTPGINSATQIELAMEYGLEILKFFPAEASGGIKMIKSLAGPYGNVKFIPTGGINLSNIKNYLEVKAVHACGGSWMAPSKLIREGKFEEITILARAAVAKVLGFGMDRTNKKIILDCVSTKRSMAFLKRMNINVEYNKDNREISLARDTDGIQVILKDNL